MGESVLMSDQRSNMGAHAFIQITRQLTTVLAGYGPSAGTARELVINMLQTLCSRHVGLQALGACKRRGLQ